MKDSKTITASSAVKKLFEDRSVRNVNEFEIVEKKTEGASAGGIGERNGKFSMLKPAVQGKAETHEEIGDKKDMITESIMAPLYKRFLYNNAPNIGLAMNPASNLESTDSELKNNVTLTSEFVEGFSTLNKANLTSHTVIDNDQKLQEKLNRIRGFEKAVVVSTFLGDNDFKGDNLGVVENASENELRVVKIDHGRSRIFSENEKNIRKNLAKNFETWGYQIIPLSIEKMIESIDEISKAQDSEIADLIRSSVYRLKNTKLELDNKTIARNYDLLEDYFIKGVTKHKKVFKDLRDQLEIISKIDMPLEWKNGNWLTDIKGSDPIKWAKDNGHTIEGKDPDAWVAAVRKESNESLISNTQIPLEASAIEGNKGPDENLVNNGQTLQHKVNEIQPDIKDSRRITVDVTKTSVIEDVKGAHLRELMNERIALKKVNRTQDEKNSMSRN